MYGKLSSFLFLGCCFLFFGPASAFPDLTPSWQSNSLFHEEGGASPGATSSNDATLKDNALSPDGGKLLSHSFLKHLHAGKKSNFREGAATTVPTKEFNVSGYLMMAPIREPSCNETITQMYVNICKGNGTPAYRLRRELTHQKKEEETDATVNRMAKRPNDISEDPEMVRSFHEDSLLLRRSKRALWVNEEDLQQSYQEILQSCCFTRDNACSVESAEKKLADLCKPGWHGTRSYSLNA